MAGICYCCVLVVRRSDEAGGGDVARLQRSSRARLTCQGPSAPPAQLRAGPRIGKPLDYGVETDAAISAKLGTNQYTEDAQPRIAASSSQNWSRR